MAPQRADLNPCGDANGDGRRAAHEERIEDLRGDEPLPQRQHADPDDDPPERDRLSHGRLRRALTSDDFFAQHRQIARYTSTNAGAVRSSMRSRGRSSVTACCATIRLADRPRARDLVGERDGFFQVVRHEHDGLLDDSHSAKQLAFHPLRACARRAR